MTYDALIAAGFIPSNTADQQQKADENGMSDYAPYTVQALLKREDVTVLIEQNDALEPINGTGRTVRVSYPPVAVVSGPKGTVACDPNNTALVEAIAKGLSNA